MVDATPATRELLGHDVIDDWRADESPDPTAIQRFRDYAEGRHQDTLTPTQRRMIGRSAFHDAADNVLRLIIQAPSSRLKLETFRVARPDDDQDTVETTPEVEDLDAALSRFWLVNQWERLQYENRFAYLRDGNSALSLSWNGADVRVAREAWWDGETGMFVARDADGTPVWAVKEFYARDSADPKTVRLRRTVYYPDLIARYIERGNGWEEYDGDGRPAMVPWVRPDGRPLGLPVIHFPNGGIVSESWYGQSSISGLLGFQDDLNSMQADMSAAARFTGFQLLKGTGIDNTQGRFQVFPGALLWDASPDADFGAIPPGDLGRLAEAHAYKRQSMAITSAVPVHGIDTQSLNNVSGVTLLRAEQPFVDNVERLAATEGPLLTQVAHRAIEMMNVFGGAGLNEDIPITSVFAPAERVDEETRVKLDQMKADLWRTIADLPYTAMMKTGLVTKDEAEAIVREREAAFGVVADMALGDGE